MSVHLSPNSIQICSDGTFIFKGYQYRLTLPENQQLTSTQSQQIIQRIEVLLQTHLASLDDLENIKIEKEKVHLQDRDIDLSTTEQELFKDIQAIIDQTLAPSPAASPQTKPSHLPPLPKLEQMKRRNPPLSFPWPPRQLEQKLVQSAEHLKQFVQDLKQKAASIDLSFFEDLEEKLDKILNLNQTNLANYAIWAHNFYKHELKNHSTIPLFFKQEFKIWMQQLQQAKSWKGVQTTLEKSIKRAYQDHVLDPLFKKEATDQERQLGQIFLHLYQADRPQYLHLRLQSAEKLFDQLIQNDLLEGPERQALQILLQEIRTIAAPLMASPLPGRVKAADSIPPYSRLDKLKQALSLIFAAVKQFFYRHAADVDAQNTLDHLEVEHVDFDENFVAKEELLRHETILDLLESKEAYLDHLMGRDPLPKHLIRNLEEEIDLYETYQKDRTWVPASQLNDDYSRLQQASKKGKKANKPENSYIPALVNSHIHQVTTEAETFFMHRSGPISYMLDGSTNLLDAQRELMERWERQINGDSFEEFEALAFEYLKQHWNKDLYQDLQAIKKRRQALEDQMMQLIVNQVKAHILEIADSSRVSLSRLTRIIQITQVSLLNPLNEFKEKSGLQVSERNQMLDMAAMFQSFNGKQIQFADVPAPFMDEGIIYLPLSFLIDPVTENVLENPDIGKPFQLSCAFFNTSVQGLKKNEGEQQIVNADGLQQMQDNLQSIQELIEKNPATRTLLKTPLTVLNHRLKQITERFNQGETGYEIAQEIILLQHDMQGMIGINCSNGCDRTGYLAAKLVAQCMDRQIDQKEEFSQEEKSALKRKLRRDLMNQEIGLASQIKHQNMGSKVLKIHERKVMGINEGEGFFGDLIRFGHRLLALSF